MAMMLVVAAAVAFAGAAGSSVAARAATTFKLPPVRHVFVIMLENESYASTFGDPSADPYLAETLPSQGALLEDYYGTGHESNDNYISIVSPASRRTPTTRATARCTPTS
jgi:hypothetical protein